ncbi:mechanosensitive ion channel domain-containing protein [Chitinibacter tainanensis]|uniref:mechanosensitive ion channel domain-containing protein n=1 Tax=Chitinibacter tainanensis TaxID=230667 RepID=UPI0003FE6086|nr:mechanosensitive ion channel domain-containing protein [Chitinibacter tainanensis]
MQLRFVLIFLLLLSFYSNAGLDALFPSQIQRDGQNASGPTKLMTENDPQRLAQKIALAQQAIDRLNASDSGDQNDNRIWLELQIYAYQQNQVALAGLAGQIELRKSIISQPLFPVDNIVDLDNRRSQLQLTDNEIKNLIASLTMQEKELEQNRSNLTNSEVELRQKTEALDKNVSDSSKKTQALQALQIAQLKQEAYSAILAAQDARQRFTRAQLQTQREWRDALNASLLKVSSAPRFEKQDLDRILSSISKRQKELKTKQQQLNGEENKLQLGLGNLIARRQELEQELRLYPLSDKVQADERRRLLSHQLNKLMQDEYLLQMRLESNAISAGLLSDSILANTLESTFWKKRFEISQSAARDQLAVVHEQILGWIKHLSGLEENLESSILVAQSQSARLFQEKDPHSQNLAQLWQAREARYSEAKAEITHNRMLFSRWADEFAGKEVTQSLGARYSQWQDTLLSFVENSWNFELFNVNDDINVDGQNVSIRRSVTIGKVIVAILLVTVGFSVCIWLGNLIERQVRQHSCWSPVAIRITKRWLLSFSFLILLINSLLLVRIPLAAFAFLGGAIAIGLGFGTQTLLKNLISGLMMLLERPFKPGDTVEVGGLRGTIVDMSVRAAVLRDINGIDTLVPNSTFLEQNVTNWTYSSSLVRQSVQVGVAYGSDVRLVARLLEDVLLQHGHIDQHQKKEILLEDFAADALVFGVYYWVDLNGSMTGRQIASDLRFMIEATLRKHNIAIAFPQRDVHIDLAGDKPLRVELQAASLSVENSRPNQA